MKFDADETAMRMDFLDINVYFHKEFGNHHFIGDASIPLYDLLESVGKKVEKAIDIKNAKNRRSGKVKFVVAAHRYCFMINNKSF